MITHKMKYQNHKHMLNEGSNANLLDPIVQLSVRKDLAKAGESIVGSQRSTLARNSRSVLMYNTVGKKSNRDI